MVNTPAASIRASPSSGGTTYVTTTPGVAGRPASVRVWLSSASSSPVKSTSGGALVLPSGFDVTKLYPELSKLGVVKTTAGVVCSSSADVAMAGTRTIVMPTSDIGSNVVVSAKNENSVSASTIASRPIVLSSSSNSSIQKISNSPISVNSHTILVPTTTYSDGSHAIVLPSGHNNSSCAKSSPIRNISYKSVPNTNSIISHSSANVVNFYKISATALDSTPVVSSIPITNVTNIASGQNVDVSGIVHKKSLPIPGEIVMSSPSISVNSVAKSGVYNNSILVKSEGASLVPVASHASVNNDNSRNIILNSTGVLAVNNSATTQGNPSQLHGSNIIPTTSTMTLVHSASAGHGDPTPAIPVTPEASSKVTDGNKRTQRLSRSPGRSSGEGGLVCASQSSVQEAELQARAKQLQLQKQLQQIHGGLSRSSGEVGMSATVKQFRLSQKQVASLLSQATLSPTSLTVVTRPSLSTTPARPNPTAGLRPSLPSSPRPLSSPLTVPLPSTTSLPSAPSATRTGKRKASPSSSTRTAKSMKCSDTNAPSASLSTNVNSISSTSPSVLSSTLENIVAPDESSRENCSFLTVKTTQDMRKLNKSKYPIVVNPIVDEQVLSSKQLGSGSLRLQDKSRTCSILKSNSEPLPLAGERSAVGFQERIDADKKAAQRRVSFHALDTKNHCGKAINVLQENKSSLDPNLNLDILIKKEPLDSVSDGIIPWNSHFTGHNQKPRIKENSEKHGKVRCSLTVYPEIIKEETRKLPEPQKQLHLLLSEQTESSLIPHGKIDLILNIYRSKLVPSHNYGTHHYSHANQNLFDVFCLVQITE